jgi:hypothetical protein
VYLYSNAIDEAPLEHLVHELRLVRLRYLKTKASHSTNQSMSPLVQQRARSLSLSLSLSLSPERLGLRSRIPQEDGSQDLLALKYLARARALALAL